MCSLFTLFLRSWLLPSTRESEIVKEFLWFVTRAFKVTFRFWFFTDLPILLKNLLKFWAVYNQRLVPSYALAKCGVKNLKNLSLSPHVMTPTNLGNFSAPPPPPQLDGISKSFTRTHRRTTLTQIEMIRKSALLRSTTSFIIVNCHMCHVIVPRRTC